MEADSRNPSAPHVHSGRIVYLDGWRGISLLFVLFGHFLPDTVFSEQIARLGVELFFVLSGRLMADILYVEQFPLPEFFKRRFSRIYPGLFVFVLLTWAATQGSTLAFKSSAVATALTFTINYAMVWQHGVAAIENLWSLCIEEHTYVLLGALALIARRFKFDPRWIILGLACVSIADAVVSATVLGQDYRTVYWRTDAHIASILLAAAGYLFLRRDNIRPWIPVAAFAAGCIVSLGSDAFDASIGTALLALSIATLAAAPAAFRRALSSAPIVTLGLWSYSIYLYQQPFYRLNLDGTLPKWIALTLAVAAGIVSYSAVEQPARRYINAKWVRRARPAPVAGLPGERAAP